MAGHPASVSVPSEPSLGRSGRLAFAGIVIGGAILAGSDVFPLFFYVPYVPVAALLVVRRPANAVSWLLLVVSLGFAMTNSWALDIAALERGTPTARDAVLAWVLSWSGLAFTLLGLLGLMLVFPTGRFRQGTAGIRARLLVWVGVPPRR
jgi:hypothetical protein